MSGRKESILKAAERSFALFGYKGTTMDQVAKIANVGKGTIYTFFKNKEELFNEIIDQFIQRMKVIAEAAIDENDPFFVNLHRALYEILSFRKEHQFTIKITQEVKEFGTLPAKQALGKFEDAILSFLEKHIQLAIDKGELVKCDPKLTAFVMLRLYIAIVFEWEQRHEPLDKEEIASLFDLYFANGLEKNKKTC
ncbi:AcrR family transcriptional regulator [Scopulibacillus daqui]|uniref:AcrR family transcriptional regulator n=2 Tax=Scopulibacillus daqui TaxID=1469162 RepID=A0ABS2PUZ2_9BACL|nr:AcrR family transcriptional regulator [Scopulibacillus daqui]